MRPLPKVATVIALALAAATGVAQAKTTLKMALIVPPDSAEGQGAARFKELVEEKSNGELEISIFPGAQLGGSYDIIEAQTAGSIEMALHGYDLFAKYSPSLMLASIAFIFKDQQHAFDYYESDLHAHAKDEILESTGIRVLGNAEWNRGPYKILLAKTPILATKDLVGMPMRVPTNEVDLLAWGEEGAGANTTPVPWPEAPLALRQGLVEAIELPADLVRPVKFYESAKYLVLTRHRYQALYNTIADAVWQELSEDEQRILLEAHEQAGKEYTDAQEANWAADQAYLKSQGVVIIDFDISDWHDKAVEIARKLEADGQWEAGLTDQLLALEP
jgi:TRAP-type C4-dicarboxylate transport system substrate-binding protein